MVSVIHSGCLDNFTFFLLIGACLSRVHFKIDVRSAKAMLGSSKVSTSNMPEESNSFPNKLSLNCFKTAICHIYLLYSFHKSWFSLSCIGVQVVFDYKLCLLLTINRLLGSIHLFQWFPCYYVLFCHKCCWAVCINLN